MNYDNFLIVGIAYSDETAELVEKLMEEITPKINFQYGEIWQVFKGKIEGDSDIAERVHDKIQIALRTHQCPDGKGGKGTLEPMGEDFVQWRCDNCGRILEV